METPTNSNYQTIADTIKKYTQIQDEKTLIETTFDTIEKILGKSQITFCTKTDDEIKPKYTRNIKKPDCTYKNQKKITITTTETSQKIIKPINIHNQTTAILKITTQNNTHPPENTRLIIELLTENMTTHLERIQRENKLTELNKHSTNISQLDDIEDILDTTITTMTHSLGYRRCSILMKYHDKLADIRLVGYGEETPHILPLTGRGITVRAANTGKTVLVQDTHADPDYIEAFRGINIRSELVVPLKTGNTVIGVLNVERIEKNGFTQQDVQLLEILANQTSRAISRVKRMNQLRKSEKNLTKLNQYIVMMTGAPTTKELNKITLQAIQKILGFNFAGIATKTTEKIVYEETLGIKLQEAWVVAEGKGITSRAFNTGKTLLINDTSQDPDYIKVEDPEIPQLLSELIVPVKKLNQTIAIINIESEKTHAFTQEHVSLTQIIAEHLAANKERINAEEERREYEEKLTSIHKHSLEIAKTTKSEEITQLTVNTIEQVFGTNHISYSEIKDNKITRVTDKHGHSLEYLPLNGSGVTVRAVKTGMTQLINNVTNDPDYIKNPEVSKTQSELAVPVKVGDRVVSLINMESDKLDAFTENDQKLVEILAESISNAISRQNRIQELEEQVQHRTAELQESNTRLKELDKMKDRFVSTAAHELRTPLTSIMGYLDIIQQKPLDEETARYLKTVTKNTHRLAVISNDLLDQQRLQSGKIKLNKQTENIQEIIQEAIQEINPLAKQRNITIQTQNQNQTKIPADRIRLTQVIINLLNNAIKFSPENTTIQINITETEPNIQISIKDNGIGLTPEDREKLFQPFPDIPKNNNYPTTGLGLSICKGIIDLHNGEITAESEGPQKGTTFTVRIPKQILE